MVAYEFREHESETRQFLFILYVTEAKRCMGQLRSILSTTTVKLCMGQLRSISGTTKG